jgi:hypothetical protein
MGAQQHLAPKKSEYKIKIKIMISSNPTPHTKY